MPKKSPEIEARKERVRRLLVIGFTQEATATRCDIARSLVRRWGDLGAKTHHDIPAEGAIYWLMALKSLGIGPQKHLVCQVESNQITEDEGWELACAEIQAAVREQHQHADRQMRVSRQLIEAVQYSVAILSTKEGRASIRRDFDQPASGLPFQISKETLEVASANLSAMAKEWK